MVLSCTLHFTRTCDRRLSVALQVPVRSDISPWLVYQARGRCPDSHGLPLFPGFGLGGCAGSPTCRDRSLLLRRPSPVPLCRGHTAVITFYLPETSFLGKAEKCSYLANENGWLLFSEGALYMDIPPLVICFWAVVITPGNKDMNKFRYVQQISKQIRNKNI